MRWRRIDESRWHLVPWALWPQVYECVVYWLEQPPWERRAKFYSEAGTRWEYRKCAT